MFPAFDDLRPLFDSEQWSELNQQLLLVSDDDIHASAQLSFFKAVCLIRRDTLSSPSPI